jgi:hypothetical protein
MLNHSSLLKCLAIFCYSELSHFATVLSHSRDFISHFITMLSHFTKLLSHSWDSIGHSLEWLTQVQTRGVGARVGRDGLHLGHRRVGRSRLTAWERVCGLAFWSRTRGTECRAGPRLAQSDYGWLVELMDLLVHITLGDIYIYIYIYIGSVRRNMIGSQCSFLHSPLVHHLYYSYCCLQTILLDSIW